MFLQVYKCKLGLETLGNIVAYETYLGYSKISVEGYDILVVILYPLQPNALILFSLAKNISTIKEGVWYEVLWLATFVINDENDEVNNVITKLLKLSYIFLHSWFVFLMSSIYFDVIGMVKRRRIKWRRYKHP